MGGTRKLYFITDSLRSVTTDSGQVFFNTSPPLHQTGALVFTPVGVTPEPATWSLMLIGVGLLGLVVVMRKRKALGHQLAC